GDLDVDAVKPPADRHEPDLDAGARGRWRRRVELAKRELAEPCSERRAFGSEVDRQVVGLRGAREARRRGGRKRDRETRKPKHPHLDTSNHARLPEVRQSFSRPRRCGRRHRATSRIIAGANARHRTTRRHQRPSSIADPIVSTIATRIMPTMYSPESPADS